ncbi:hypothetical protein OKW34_008795 [Paraburkholderia youngii]|uniref:hypothetical protein n=1 Tax=Paraburkholderia youngii TaxID=2782701 RepID=UPI003D1FCB60
MNLDPYTKVALTVIAICLLVLAGRTISVGLEAEASTSLKCSGELRANPNGATAPSIGGYIVNIQCNN